VIHQPVTLLMIFVLSAFVGFEVISKVPSILHTPLMSGSNAIHGVILVGAMIIANEAHGALEVTLALVAVILATLNIVGGVAVTDRMLEMFKGRGQVAHPRAAEPAAASLAPASPAPPSPAAASPAASPAPPSPAPPSPAPPSPAPPSADPGDSSPGTGS
jgi:NAD(P) transhydrogenase subunit alpha